MSWVHDHCTVGWFDYEPTPGWARGILNLHATCEPPCPRKLVAEQYLRELAAAEEESEANGRHLRVVGEQGQCS